MKKHLCFLSAVLFILSFCAAAAAEKAEWKAPGYDMSAVQKIYVESEPVKADENIILSDLEDLKIRQSIEENKQHVKKYRVAINEESADAVLTVRILKWGKNRYWVEPQTVTENKTITHKDKDGKTSTVTIPVTTTKPGYYYYTQYFSAKYELTDKSGRKIFERIDSREDTKNAYDMFNRATRDFFKDVNSLK